MNLAFFDKFPVIETGRLHLRELLEEDAESVYEISSAFWGRGFATEALRSVVDFCHNHAGLNRIEAAVMHGNEASVRVLQKTGFLEEGVMRAYGYWKGAYHDLRIFSVLRPGSQP